jgi:hypothetical protein
MALLPFPEGISQFLVRQEKKALLVVSRSFVPQSPFSLQERLLAMTLRANATMRRLDEERGCMEAMQEAFQAERECFCCPSYRGY